MSRSAPRVKSVAPASRTAAPSAIKTTNHSCHLTTVPSLVQQGRSPVDGVTVPLLATGCAAAYALTAPGAATVRLPHRVDGDEVVAGGHGVRDVAALDEQVTAPIRFDAVQIDTAPRPRRAGRQQGQIPGTAGRDEPQPA